MPDTRVTTVSAAPAAPAMPATPHASHAPALPAARDAATITVHHLNDSRSQRVLWLLEELELPYTLCRYQRDPVTMLAPAALEAVHPLGKSPVITDGTVTLAESGAIVDYLIEHRGAGRLRPQSGTLERIRYDYWLHFAEGSAMPPLIMRLVMDKVEEKSPWLVRPIARAIARQVKALVVTPNLDRQLAFMDRELRERGPWFAGSELSGADIQMSFPVIVQRSISGFTKRWPALADFVGRVQARPAWQRAIEKGGPLRL